MNFLKLKFSEYFFILFIMLIYCLTVDAQNQNWIHIINGATVNGLAETENEIYATTLQGGIVVVDKESLKSTYLNRFNSGLQNEYFTCAGQTDTKTLWFGSTHFLVKKQGDQFEYFNTKDSGLPINIFYDLTADDKGNVWIPTYLGLIKFDGKNWQVFNNENSPINNSITAVYCQKDTVWVGLFSGGLLKYVSGKWTNLSPSGSTLAGLTVTSITKEKNQFWVGTNQMGPFHFDGTQWIKHFGSPGLSTLKSVQDIVISSNGDVYVGYFHKEISKFNGSGWEKIDLPQTNFDINKMLMDDNDRLWVTMRQEGFNFASGLLVLKDNVWTKIRTTQYLPDLSGHVKFLEKSCDGKMWVSAANKIALGNVRGIDSVEWKVLLGDKLKGNSLGGFYTDEKDNNWITSSDAGLYKYDGKTLIHYNTKNSGIPTNQIYGVTGDRKGKIYIRSIIGLITFDGKNWELFTKENSALPSNSIRTVFVDNNNYIWISTADGVIQIVNNKWKLYNVENSGLPSRNVYAINQDREGKIWFGTGRGVAVFNKNKWQVFNVENSGISDNSVHDIAFDRKGNCWLAAQKGINVFNGKDWRIINSENSKLPDVNVNCIEFDGNGNLWMGLYNKGLAIFNEFEIETLELSPNSLITFPNPTTDFLNFQIDEQDCGKQYFIVNNFGQIIHSGTTLSTSEFINVEHYSSGVYYIIIQGNSKSITGKFVKL
ncbi:MAG: T9SS type A sorting domain-containing protein [Saprospiraceae bacterium]|nr:T9SS type A sorting domain-containing protein [Saprospiraceae bacterium]